MGRLRSRVEELTEYKEVMTRTYQSNMKAAANVATSARASAEALRAAAAGAASVGAGAAADFVAASDLSKHVKAGDMAAGNMAAFDQASLEAQYPDLAKLPKANKAALVSIISTLKHVIAAQQKEITQLKQNSQRSVCLCRSSAHPNPCSLALRRPPPRRSDRIPSFVCVLCAATCVT